VEYNITMEFESLKTKEVMTFKSMPNPLNNSQMYWIEPLPHMFHGSVSNAKTMAKDIKESCNVISEENICNR